MLTTEEHLKIGFNMLKRLKQGKSPVSGDAGRASNRPDSRRNAPYLGIPAIKPEEVSVPALIEQGWSFSGGSLVLGICEDGLPFVLDLNNPAPGSLLVAGDAQSGKTRMLRSALASVSHLNDPDEVLFSIIAQDPAQYTDLAQDPNCMELLAAGGSAAEDLIWRLSDLVEQRRRGREQGPALILVIDDLASAMQSSERELLERLFKILVHGPRSRVWVLASLSTEQMEQVDERLLAAFRTPLIGPLASAQQAAYLSGDTTITTRDLAYGKQFFAPLGGEWVRFWICADQ